LKVLSLFSGAGGSCLGWHSFGVEHALCCEWDASAGATLAAAGFPWSPTDLSDSEALRAALSPLAGSIDVLEASPPCQAWSSAGSRLGAKDPRNGWPWTWEACDVVKPRWLIAENVPGLLCHRGDCPTRVGGYAEPLDCPGCYWSEVVLEEARRRFAWVGWWLLNAADYGVPQHRRRVFLVCGPHQASPPQPTHGDPATLRQRGLFGPRRLPWVTMREALNLGGSAEVIGYPGRNDAEWSSPDQPSRAVRSGGAGHDAPGLYVQHMEGAPRDLSQPAPALGSRGNTMLLERPSPSVSASSEIRGSGAGSNPEKMQRASDALYLSTGRRRLTVAEVAALQGFPADHPWQGTQTSRYRQVGNAVPPALAGAVAKSIIEVALSESNT
jgi:DNA (cytosine-5)-methyltransferase 1